MIYLGSVATRARVGESSDIGILTSYGATNTGRDNLSRTLWAADNGCFLRPNLDVEKYLSWLESLSPYQSTCLFAVAPDVVANASATIERSAPVLPKIRALGYRAALVAQDGLENLMIDWPSFDCLFIGGSTEWKLSEAAFGLIAEAKAKNKWVHMGRVNSRQRIRIARQAGCDSVDGTHIRFKPDVRIEQLKRWFAELHAQPFLFNNQTEPDTQYERLAKIR